MVAIKVHKLRKEYNKVKRQIFASLIANLIVLAQGCSVGWLSPALPILLSKDSPLATGSINLIELSWIGSIMAIGAACGTCFVGIVSSYIGSKNALLWCSIPVVIHWIIIRFSNYVWQICLARFLSGFAGGGAFICIPLFVAEIANDHVRGSLSSILTVFFNIGQLFGLVLGSMVNYQTYPMAVIIFPIIFYSLFLYFPDTPHHLLKKGRIMDAEKSLKFYRNFNMDSVSNREDFVIEFEKLKAIAKQNELFEGLKISDFYEPAAWKGIIVGIILMAISSFTGSFTLINYASAIFKQSGSSIDPNHSAISLGAIQICGTLCTIAVIDRLGRKILMIFSTAGVAISLSVMGAYSYLNKHGHDLTDYNLVPVISLSLVIFLSAIGITPVPYVMVAEILPQKVRRAGATICITLVSVFAFLSLKVFPLLMDIIQIYGCMAIFVIVALFGLVFIILIIEETKGKNLDTLESSN